VEGTYSTPVGVPDRRHNGEAASQGARRHPLQRGDGAAIFAHACKLGFEGIVSKHREHPYRSGPSKVWLKIKNPAAPGVTRFEDRT
jgi:bifunctional non-homologous end joining protein LigD